LNYSFREKNPNKSGYFDKVDISGYYRLKLYQKSWSISEKIVGYSSSYLDGIVGKSEHFKFDADELVLTDKHNN